MVDIRGKSVMVNPYTNAVPYGDAVVIEDLDLQILQNGIVPVVNINARSGDMRRYTNID